MRSYGCSFFFQRLDQLCHPLFDFIAHSRKDFRLLCRLVKLPVGKDFLKYLIGGQIHSAAEEGNDHIKIACLEVAERLGGLIGEVDADFFYGNNRSK